MPQRDNLPKKSAAHIANIQKPLDANNHQ